MVQNEWIASKQILQEIDAKLVTHYQNLREEWTEQKNFHEITGSDDQLKVHCDRGYDKHNSTTAQENDQEEPF